MDINEIKDMKAEAASKDKRKIWIIPIVIIILVLLIFGGCELAKFLEKPQATGFLFDEMAQDGFLDGKTKAEIDAMMNQAVAEGQFNVSINPQPVFTTGASEGTINIENIIANRYYMRVEITLQEDGSMLYKSKGIKQGQFIEKIKLDKVLPKGKHYAIATFYAINPNNLEDVGSTSVTMEITVEN